MSRVAVGWGENTVGQSAPSEPAACFVGGRISERVEKKRGSHGRGFRVAGPTCVIVKLTERSSVALMTKPPPGGVHSSNVSPLVAQGAVPLAGFLI